MLEKTLGAATLIGSGAVYTFDFGTLAQGTASVSASLSLSNLVTGPADTLGATFSVGSGPFTLAGFESFNGLEAGGQHVLDVGLDPVTAGLFEQVVDIGLYGTNASGYRGDIANFEVMLRGRVISTAPVPLPPAAWMFGAALVALIGRGDRQRGACDS